MSGRVWSKAEVDDACACAERAMSQGLRLSLAWLDGQIRDNWVEYSIAHGLFTLHAETEQRLEYHQDRLAAAAAPWFAIEQGMDRWWGFDPLAYDCYTTALWAMRGAVGWVTIRGFDGPVWFGPDRDDSWMDDMDLDDAATLSEMVAAEVDLQIEEAAAMSFLEAQMKRPAAQMDSPPVAAGGA